MKIDKQVQNVYTVIALANDKADFSFSDQKLQIAW
jgi:hypothetical protein